MTEQQTELLLQEIQPDDLDDVPYSMTKITLIPMQYSEADSI